MYDTLNDGYYLALRGGFIDGASLIFLDLDIYPFLTLSYILLFCYVYRSSS